MSFLKYFFVFCAFVDSGFAIYEHAVAHNLMEAIYWSIWITIDLLAFLCVTRFD